MISADLKTLADYMTGEFDNQKQEPIPLIKFY
jgi:hypothetical protein